MQIHRNKVLRRRVPKSKKQNPIMKAFGTPTETKVHGEALSAPGGRHGGFGVTVLWTGGGGGAAAHDEAPSRWVMVWLVRSDPPGFGL